MKSPVEEQALYLVCGIDVLRDHSMCDNMIAYPPGCFGVFDNLEQAKECFRKKVIETVKKNLQFFVTFEGCVNADEAAAKTEEDYFADYYPDDESESSWDCDSNVCWSYSEHSCDWNGNQLEAEWKIWCEPWEGDYLFPYFYIRKVTLPFSET